MLGAMNNVLSNGNHTNDNNTTASSSSLLVDVLSNGNHKNDNNTTAPSSSLSVDTVTVAVALPCHGYGLYIVYIAISIVCRV